MKKNIQTTSLTGFTLLLLCLGSLHALAGPLTPNSQPLEPTTITYTQTFTPPEITEHNNNIQITMPETNTYTTQPGQPQLPTYKKTIEFPLGTTITHIDIQSEQTKTMSISTKQLQFVPQHNQLSTTDIPTETNIYTTLTQPYPNTWYSTTQGAGLNKNNEHVLYVTIQLNPVQYNPDTMSLHYKETFNVQISYKQPIQQQNIVSETYDLIVISPTEYLENLQPLIDHKNNHGVSTNLVDVETIYSTYTGRDKPEQIKYFIKDCIENWDTTYVLLVGDIKKLPIRKTYASWWEPDLLTDLYYADIYDSNNMFCTWDSNGNNRFGEIQENGYDIDGVDLYADVHIGRLACTDLTEVDTTVNKIIQYEQQTYGSEWFKKIIVAGGDTFPLIYAAPPFIYEGEITNKKVLEQLPEFTPVKLWASRRNLNALTFNFAINKGAGFVTYSGHGFEYGWGTYRPNAIRNHLITYYNVPFVQYLNNEYKLPIIFFDACLTAKLDFNITDLYDYPKIHRIIELFTDLSDDPTQYYTVTGWHFVKENDGGAVATIGATRTAYSWVSIDGPLAGAGLLNLEFFKSYDEGITLGEMLTQAQIGYIDQAGKDYFTIEEFILLGDPSLKVGGFQ